MVRTKRRARGKGHLYSDLGGTAATWPLAARSHLTPGLRVYRAFFFCQPPVGTFQELLHCRHHQQRHRAQALVAESSVGLPPVTRERGMPITPFLNGERLDLEDKRVLGLAFEMVCIALRIGDCDDGVKQAIATKIIDLAKAGERNPDTLCEQALKDIRSPPPQV